MQKWRKINELPKRKTETQRYNDEGFLPFNRPHLVGTELQFLKEALASGKLCGDGRFTKACQQWLEESVSTEKALLTHSCTAALEMAAILLNIRPGDEVVMPSYTFVSTANAFVLRGAIPVFVDIRKDTLNINEELIEHAITDRTRAIVAVHYAGVACEMDRITEIARKYKLAVVEDAAQALLSEYKGRRLGSIGDIGAFSFHETKNIISGEGGAITIQDSALIERAEIIREKGTNRAQFIRGQVDKYTWEDVGSSFLPSELIAGFLWAQLDHAESIIERRLDAWEYYHQSLEQLETSNVLSRPVVPAHCKSNGHIYYIIVSSKRVRDRLIDSLRSCNIVSTFHYIPLHSSPAGAKYSKVHGDMHVTDKVSECLVRLPLWVGIERNSQDRICEIVKRVLFE